MYQKIDNAKFETKLKKRKIEIVNEANSYTEEVRRIVKKIYGFEKLYSQGLSINTPLNTIANSGVKIFERYQS